MRWLFFVAALAFTSVASAQDGSSLRDIGPFRFGMSVDEARAADPSLRSRDDRGIDLTSFRSRTPTAFGEIGITPLLSFRGGRLTRVVFETGGPVREDGRCAEVFDMVLGALEERHGAFSGASGPSEYGELRSTRTTARGSTVRVYEHAGQSMRHANRPDGGWMEVVAHVGPYPNVPSGMMLCMITIDVRPQALPPPLDLASPTSAQLASARVLENPQWSEQADSDAYEMALPPYFPTADVEL